MHLSSEELSFLPSEADLANYRRLGWHASPVMLPPDLIERARHGAQRFYAGERDFPFAPGGGVADDANDSAQPIRNNEFVSLQVKEIQELGHHPLIAAVAARLAGVKQMRMFADSLIDKRPTKMQSSGAVGWHTDKAYWPTCSSEKLVTAWIPLQDCTIEMGALTHLDGSHLWHGKLDFSGFFSFNNQNLEDLERHLREHRLELNKSTMLLKAGQVSFHHCRTIHASYPNRSDRNRTVLVMHFQDGENRHREARRPDGSEIEISYDRICRRNSAGRPDYTDPVLFPLLWTEPAK
jgi:hypothetical protein